MPCTCDAVAEVESEHVTEEVDRCLVVLGEQCSDTVHETLARHLRRVVVGNLKTPGEQVAQESVRLLAGVWLSSTLEDHEPIWLHVGPVLELVQQPALAQARLGNHRDDPQRRRRVQRGERPLQAGQLRGPTDHLGLQPFDARASGRGTPEAWRRGSRRCAPELGCP